MEFEEIVMKRYATKKFDGRKIDEKLVERLLEIIRFAPSSYNMQPWKVMVISDRETKEKLCPCTWNQVQITTCSHLLVFCAYADLEGRLQKRLEQMKVQGLDEAKIEGYKKSISRKVLEMGPQQKIFWAQKQIYIALGNALNGAKSLGFDSCPIEGFEPEKYSEILGLPENLVPTVLCPIGYAADDQLVQRDKWSTGRLADQSEPRKKVRMAKEEVFF